MTNLTEQLKKGELPYAEYYIKLAGGEYTRDVWDIDGWQSFNKKGDVVVEVLAEVPSYEELQNQAFILKSRESEIVKLKELLKECSYRIDWTDKTGHKPTDDERQKLFDAISQVLGEE